MRPDSEDEREIDRQRLLQGNVGVLFAFDAVTNYSRPKATGEERVSFLLYFWSQSIIEGRKNQKSNQAAEALEE